MKSFVLIALAMCMPSVLSAQVWLGPKAGVSMSSMHGSAFNNFNDYDYQTGRRITVETSSLVAVTAGVYALFQWSDNFAFQPELSYTAKGTKVERTTVYSSTYYDDVFRDEGRYDISYIDIAVLSRLTFPNQLRLIPSLLFGPTFSVRTGTASITSKSLDGTNAGKEQTSDAIDSQLADTDIGLTVGAGLEYVFSGRSGSRVGIDLRYTLGIKNIFTPQIDGMDFYDSDNERYNGSLAITVGYAFRL